MRNCNGHGHHHGCCENNGGHGHHRGDGCCSKGMHRHNHDCQQGKGGKKRELFMSKYEEYLKTITLPEFVSDEEYSEWLNNTDEGKKHLENIKKINTEVDAECPWGGKRENAGRRKECIRKVPYTRRLSLDSLNALKTYAEKNNMTETEALEQAISNLK